MRTNRIDVHGPCACRGGERKSRQGTAIGALPDQWHMPEPVFLCARCVLQVGEMRQSGVVPKLRTFTPALTAYCEVHDINNVRVWAFPINRGPFFLQAVSMSWTHRSKALEVEADIRSAGLIPSDVEYAALLRCMSRVRHVLEVLN
jgi:hypothetical protein